MDFMIEKISGLQIYDDSLFRICSLICKMSKRLLGIQVKNINTIKSSR